MKRRCAICRGVGGLNALEIRTEDTKIYRLRVNNRSPEPLAFVCEWCIRQVKKLPFTDFVRTESKDLPF